MRHPPDWRPEEEPPDQGLRPIHILLIGGLCCLVAIVAVVAVLLVAGGARSEDRGAWFKSLRQPVTGASCCDISDCRMTKAAPVSVLRADGTKGDQWWADVQGEWMPIPPEKVLHDKPSIDGEAYVCSGYGRKIFCFVPPTMAM